MTAAFLNAHFFLSQNLFAFLILSLFSLMQSADSMIYSNSSAFACDFCQ